MTASYAHTNLKMPDANDKPVWRSGREIDAIKQEANKILSGSGTHMVIDRDTLKDLIQVCVQAAHTERGHGNW